jgi:hypothetical protein
MEKTLKQIREGTLEKRSEKSKRRKEKAICYRRDKTQSKKEWYEIGKTIAEGYKVKMHTESQVGARRTYAYYSKNYGDWEGPSA